MMYCMKSANSVDPPLANLPSFAILCRNQIRNGNTRSGYIVEACYSLPSCLVLISLFFALPCFLPSYCYFVCVLTHSGTVQVPYFYYFTDH